MNYDKIRELAIIDARRRYNFLAKKIPTWNIIDKVRKDGSTEKNFVYELGASSFVNLTFSEYATLREIKYIVWRFEVSKEEILNIKLKTFVMVDIYGDKFEYKCNTFEDALDCFDAENGEDRFDFGYDLSSPNVRLERYKGSE